MKILSVIPCINLWDSYTKPAIESVKSKHDSSILVIDNASVDNTSLGMTALMQQRQDLIYKRNIERWSFAKSVNYGVRYGIEHGYDYIAVLNNDILLNPLSLDILAERMGKGDVGMATCMNMRGELDDPQAIFTYNEQAKKDVPEAEHPDFSAFMVNKKTWDTVGEFDELFSPAFFEDNDYHYRMMITGMKAVTVPTAVYYHFGSRTQNEADIAPMVSSPMFEHLRSKYIEKWGGNPGEEQFTKPYDNPQNSVKTVKQHVF